MVPGERYVPLPQPGFRWNVLDYGGPNTISSPLRNSRRCGDLGVALANACGSAVNGVSPHLCL